ncbi:hypothetical protein J7E89_20350 [Streptomyces sp. ISL-100]|nr:hypothetical protein [Streptomyces sp. ISL-100]
MTEELITSRSGAAWRLTTGWPHAASQALPPGTRPRPREQMRTGGEQLGNASRETLGE